MDNSKNHQESLRNNCPDAGDIVICDLSPTTGHEQSGNRPCLVISNKSFNFKTGLVVVCPITSSEKDFVFYESINTEKTTGSVLTHQLRTLDWVSRKAIPVDRIDSESLEKVMYKIRKIINL